MKVNGQDVIPRNILHSLLYPKVTFQNDKDLVVIRIKCFGEKNGKESLVLLDLIDYYDNVTGFTAMERTTGWDASIVAIMMAHGKIKKGAIPVELAVPGPYFVEELQKRGIKLSANIKELNRK
ncbi:MAG: saccharopine dehydrogenase C-terminal domain-containing protein [Promethearchaeota archaeon]